MKAAKNAEKATATERTAAAEHAAATKVAANKTGKGKRAEAAVEYVSLTVEPKATGMHEKAAVEKTTAAKAAEEQAATAKAVETNLIAAPKASECDVCRIPSYVAMPQKDSH